MENERIFTIDERVERFRKFYKKENSRALFGFFSGSEYPLFRYNAAKKLPENIALTPDDFIVEEYLDDFDRLFNEHEMCGGDFIWSGSAFWGIPWLEAALGCPIFANHQTGSIYSNPIIDEKETFYVPNFDENSPWIVKTKEFLKKMAERSSGKWPIGTTRMRGITDILAAIYGGERFLDELMFGSEEICMHIDRITDFWIKYGKFQLDNIPLFHEGVGSFYYNMWAPRGTIWFQEDCTSLISPGLYTKFFTDSDKKIADSFENCIMHQHSVGYQPLDEYLKMGFTAIELHIDEGGPSAEELWPKHMKILNKKPLLIWGDISQKDLDWIFSNLPHEGLAVCTVVNSHEQAQELRDRYISVIE